MLTKLFIRLSAAIILLLGLIVSLSLTCGFLVKQKCQQVVNTLGAISPVAIEIVDYRRHWFSSDITFIITANKSYFANKPYGTFWQDNLQFPPLKATAHVSHGPVVIDLKKVRLAQAVIATKLQLPQLDVKLQTIVKLSGKTFIDLYSKPYRLRSEETNIDLAALKLSIILNNRLNNINQQFSLPSLNLATPNIKLAVTNLKTSYDGERNNDALWIGNHAIDLEYLTLTTPKKHSITLEKLKANSTMSITANSLTNLVDINLKHLDIDGAIYSQNNLTFSTDKVDTTALTTLLTQMKLQKISLATGTLAQEIYVLPLLIDLLMGGAEFSLQQLRSVTPWGKLAATAKLTINPLPGGLSLVKMLSNTNLAVSLDMQTNLALNLLEHVQINPTKKSSLELLQKWRTENKVTFVDDNSLHIDIIYKEAQLFLNNKPFEFIFATTQHPTVVQKKAKACTETTQKTQAKSRLKTSR